MGATPQNPILEYFSNWSPFLLLLLGGLLTQLWNRFRTRMRRLTWRAWHSKIAIATNDPHWGTVTVQFNDIPVNHVHITTVEFNNDSSEDQKDVRVTLSFQDGRGQIIASQATIEGSLDAIPLDDGYADQFDGATTEQVRALATHVVHKIPVLNRRQKAVFTLLVVRDDASAPFVQVLCNHPGCKLEFLAAGPEVNGVPLNLALPTGTLLTAAVIFLLVRYQRHPHPYLNPFFGWLLGLYVARVGATVVRAWKSVLRLLG